MTPFERNLEVWRQLWRVLERSDALVQVLDARDPLFYRSPDLERYARCAPGRALRLCPRAAQ
jgi:large subunit GTPase 1